MQITSTTDKVLMNCREWSLLCDPSEVIIHILIFLELHFMAYTLVMRIWEPVVPSLLFYSMLWGRWGSARLSCGHLVQVQDKRRRYPKVFFVDVHRFFARLFRLCNTLASLSDDVYAEKSKWCLALLTSACRPSSIVACAVYIQPMKAFNWLPT